MGWRPVLALLLLFAAFALIVSPAFGKFEKIGSFAGGGSGPGGSGSEPGQLSNPGQVDVSDATGNVYVADTGNNRVEVFKPTATAAQYDTELAIAAPTGVAVDQANGDLYVANASGISKFDSSLTPVAGWTDPGVTGALAVDPSSGDLLVADTAASLVRRFESDGTAAGTFAAERPLDIAADASGSLLVVTSTGDLFGCANSTVERFSADGTAEGTVGGSLVAPSSVAIDPDDDSIAIAANTNGYNCPTGEPEVATFDAGGDPAEAISLAGTAYATVPGLAAQGGGSARTYVITKSPAGDAFGPTQAIVLANPLPALPAVMSQSASANGSEIELTAILDRGNVAAEYQFELGRTAGYGLATPAAQLPSGSSPVTVKRTFAGLEPGVTYHYRVVVRNALGTAEGADRVITTAPATGTDGCPNAGSRSAQSAAFLPQCRAWEVVSPADKNGNDLFLERAQASLDGSGLAFVAGGAFGDAESSSLETAYVSFRGADAWHTEGIAPPMQNTILLVESVRQLSDDLRYTAGTARTVAEPGAVNFLRRSASAHAYELLSPRPNGEKWNIFEGYGSADLGRYVFVSEGPLNPGDPPPGLYPSYLYEGTAGSSGLRLVKVGALLGSGRSLIAETAVSADGSRIFYSTPSGPVGAAPSGQLFMQRNGTETIEVSASKLATPETERSGAMFFQANRSGTKVLFGDPERLTEDSKANGGETTLADFGDLYLYDVERDELTDLAASAPAGGGHLLGLLGVSDDFSTVYFADRAVLAPGATPGAPNVYVWTAGGSVELVATLAEADAETWAPQWQGRQARVSADGSALVFQSTASLGGYDLNGFVGVYRYDRGVKSTVCVSCSGAEATADGRMLKAAGQNLGNIGGHQANLVSADGSTVFFTTAAKLDPDDTNGLADVYSWRGGSTSLLSSGRGDAGSFFLDASPNGADVFFATRQRLVASDTDTLVDAYDARVNGGLPEPLPPPPPCLDEGCKTPTPDAPSGAMPGSTARLGSGVDCAGLSRKAARLKSKAAAAGRRAAAAEKGKPARRARTAAKRARKQAKAAVKNLNHCKRGQR